MFGTFLVALLSYVDKK
ncbi:putative holin-like toxin [Chakrabartyella piscis]|nr:putative holin-like toxin [Chakrabartyella piscis]